MTKPRLLDLVAKAEASQRAARASADTASAESARLEAQLLAEINAAVASAVGQIDLSPIVAALDKPTVDITPHIQGLSQDIKKAAFVDKTKEVKASVQALADQVVLAVQRAVASIPRTDVLPILKEVRSAVEGIVMPKLMMVTKWKFTMNRDSAGLLESVDADAVEYGEAE